MNKTPKHIKNLLRLNQDQTKNNNTYTGNHGIAHTSSVATNIFKQFNRNTNDALNGHNNKAIPTIIHNKSHHIFILSQRKQLFPIRNVILQFTGLACSTTPRRLYRREHVRRT